MSLLPYLHRAVAGEGLSDVEAQEAMAAILCGQASTAQIAAFLVALRMKGETAQELLGFARAMRAVCNRVCPQIGSEPLLDTCGTGGDGAGTFNVSTIAALALDPALAARAIQEIGFGFLFAPALHPAMKHAQPARLELKMRTVFNLL